MQEAIAGQNNTLMADMVNRNTGAAISAGTITAYLRARNGTNANKWWNGSTAAWSATKAAAGTMSFLDSSLWTITIVAAAWDNGVTYDFYAVEGANVHIPYTDLVKTWSSPTRGAGGIEWTYTLTDSVTSQPVPDAEIWVTKDAAGSNTIAYDRTDDNGQVTFYLDAGTYYVWGSKSGYTFDNPDTEVVS